MWPEANLAQRLVYAALALFARDYVPTVAEIAERAHLARMRHGPVDQVARCAGRHVGAASPARAKLDRRARASPGAWRIDRDGVERYYGRIEPRSEAVLSVFRATRSMSLAFVREWFAGGNDRGHASFR